MEPAFAPAVWIRVHPDYEGQGVEALLLQSAEARARQTFAKAPQGARIALCTTTVSVNQVARRFFYQNGFALARRYWRAVCDLDETPATLCRPEAFSGRHPLREQGGRLLYRYDLYEKELRPGEDLNVRSWEA
jgi:hypothetical protein